jgi:signal transduction histidine kinase
VSETATVRAPEVRDATILLVDDEEANVRLLTRILTRSGFTSVHATTDSSEALGLFATLAPDLIVLDVRMPRPDGFEILHKLAEVIAPNDYLPVLAVTGDAAPGTRQRVLIAGARDFLEKPFESAEVVVRIENLLTTRRLHRSLQRQNLSLEEKVRERTAELETALAAAEAGSRTKSQFLASISHELRTPLNAIIGFANHLRKNKAGNLLPQDLGFLQRIGDNGTHLLTLITDILDLSRIEAGKMVVDHHEVALDQLVTRALGQVEASSTQTANARVQTRMCLPSPLRPLLTDEDKLRRVLLNLVGNAAKFTDNGYLCVAVSASD